MRETVSKSFIALYHRRSSLQRSMPLLSSAQREIASTFIPLSIMFNQSTRIIGASS